MVSPVASLTITSMGFFVAFDIGLLAFKAFGMLHPFLKMATPWIFYSILAPRIADGVTFDPPIMNIFEELKQEFGK